MHPDVWRRQAGGFSGFGQASCHGAAKIGIRQQGGELRLALCLSRGDQPADLLAGGNAKGPNAGCGLRASLVNARTGIPALRAIGATAAVSVGGQRAQNQTVSDWRSLA